MLEHLALQPQLSALRGRQIIHVLYVGLVALAQTQNHLKDDQTHQKGQRCISNAMTENVTALPGNTERETHTCTPARTPAHKHTLRAG